MTNGDYWGLVALVAPVVLPEAAPRSRHSGVSACRLGLPCVTAGGRIQGKHLPNPLPV